MASTSDLSTSVVPEGMGAIPHAGGVAFRVWAPHAEAVFVAGSFSGGARTRHPLAPEPGGCWSADVPDASIGDSYQFILCHAGRDLVRVDPYARSLGADGRAVVCCRAFDWADDPFTLPPAHDLVVYALAPPPDANTAEGLTSLLRRLDDLVDLGVNVVTLGVSQPPCAWGYNPAHPFCVGADTGGPRAFQQFIREAHRRGLGVVLDVAYHHIEGEALWQFDGWGADGGIYFYTDHRAITIWGDTRPDYGRPEVRRYLRDNALMWFDEFHVDGLRWDHTVMVRNIDIANDPSGDLPDGWRLMQEVNDAVRARYPHALLIAEDLQRNDYLTAPVAEGGAGFSAQDDAGFVEPIREALRAPAVNGHLDAIVGAIRHDYNGEPFERVIYREQQSAAEAGALLKRSALEAVLTFTAPGIPMLFDGQEVFGHATAPRTPYADHLRRLHCDLIRLRRGGGCTRGLAGPHTAVYHVNQQDKVLAFRRWHHAGPGDDVIVVLNFSDRAYDAYRLGFPQPGPWRVRFNSDWNGYSAAFGNQAAPDVDAVAEPHETMLASGTVAIGPYAALILSQDPPAMNGRP